MHTRNGIGVALSLGLWLGIGLLRAAGDPARDDFLRDCLATRSWTLGQPVKAQPTPDGTAVLFLRSPPRSPRLGLFEFDVATGQAHELANPEQWQGGSGDALSAEEKARRERMRVTAGGFADFQLSPDGGRVLLGLGGRLFLLDRRTAMRRALDIRGAPPLDPKFSPDGRRIAFVRDHDVHVFDLVRWKERAVTHGGTAAVSHGLAEFVAQEEMNRFSGYWWSPDGRFIAYEEADARGVESWFVADPAQPGQAPSPSPYPRPGRNNVQARLGVISAGGGKTTWVSWDAARYPYLARVEWHKAAGLTLTVQTRDQQELVLLRVDRKSGRTATLVAERDPCWVNLDPQVPHWLDDGRFLWTSEREGGWQLEIRDRDGRLERVLVPPGDGYRDLVAVDESSGEVYYRASADPTQAHLWRVALGGGDRVSLTSGQRGQHGAAFAKNFSIYVHTMASLDDTARSLVRRKDGSLVGELPSLAETPPFLPAAEIVRVGADGGYWAKVIRPHGFDATRRYPVIVHAYGGPHAQMVQASLGGGFLDQWLADQGFIVVSMDGRGTPGRGRDWERAIFHEFATVPLADQIAALRALGRRFPEFDLERVGIHGWSFGGYLSALAALRRPDVFKAAFAGAPVTDWFDYDTHYTERYLGVPAGAQDEVYRRNSLLEDAPSLRAGLLLVHGTADDNVYFRHTLKLADALLRAGRDFEVLPLKGFTHLVPDVEVSAELWRRRAAFFRRRLGVPGEGR